MNVFLVLNVLTFSFIFSRTFYCYMYGGSVTTGRQTGDQQVAGLIRGRGAAA